MSESQQAEASIYPPLDEDQKRNLERAGFNPQDFTPERYYAWADGVFHRVTYLDTPIGKTDMAFDAETWFLVQALRSAIQKKGYFFAKDDSKKVDGISIAQDTRRLHVVAYEQALTDTRVSETGEVTILDQNQSSIDIFVTGIEGEKLDAETTLSVPTRVDATTDGHLFLYGTKKSENIRTYATVNSLLYFIN